MNVTDPSANVFAPFVVRTVLVPAATALPMAVPLAYRVTVAPATVLPTVNESDFADEELLRLVIPSLLETPESLPAFRTGAEEWAYLSSRRSYCCPTGDPLRRRRADAWRSRFGSRSRCRTDAITNVAVLGEMTEVKLPTLPRRSTKIHFHELVLVGNASHEISYACVIDPNGVVADISFRP